MERTPKNIDDLLRERLHDAAPPPPAFVWDNVALELQKRNRRKLLFWMFFTGIAGAALLGWWFAAETLPVPNAINIESKQTIVPSQAVDKYSSAETTLQPSNSPSVTNNTTIETSLQPSQSRPATDKTATEISRQLNTALHTPISKGLKTPTPTQQGFDAVMAQKSVSNLNTTPNTPKEATPVPQPQKTVFEEDRDLTKFSFPLLPQYQGLFLENFKTTALASTTLRQSWPTLLMPMTSKTKAKKAVKNCYDFSRQPSAWIIDAHTGPSLAQRELTASPDDKPYLVKRLSTEARDLAFNAGVRATLMLKGNFLIRTGVQYEQMTEVFEFIDPDYVKYHVEITTQNGITTIDTVGVDYGERYQKTYNRYGMLDIPLAAGIEMRKGRSGFNINAGVSFNMLFWKRGAIISPSTGEPAWFTPKDGTLEVFRPRTGLSATASIQWFYHVTPRLRVFVEPYYKKILRPVTLNHHPVEQRYGLGGLRLGVSKILN